MPSKNASVKLVTGEISLTKDFLLSRQQHHHHASTVCESGFPGLLDCSRHDLEWSHVVLLNCYRTAKDSLRKFIVTLFNAISVQGNGVRMHRHTSQHRRRGWNRRSFKLRYFKISEWSNRCYFYVLNGAFYS